MSKISEMSIFLPSLIVRINCKLSQTVVFEAKNTPRQFSGLAAYFSVVKGTGRNNEIII